MGEKEIWKDIPGYEGQYQASTLGHIRSVSRIVSQPMPDGTTRQFYRHGKILAAHRNRDGYFCVTLCNKGSRAKFQIHQLVALTFLGKPEAGEVTRHLNGDKADNTVFNLAYGSQSDNMKDVYLQGKRRYKLTMAQVQEIKRQLSVGIRNCDIARAFQVSRATVCDILKGRKHAWIS